MSLVTRCPECATAFRVSQAQIDLRGGKVRCGRCSEVFDALASAEEPAASAAEAAHDLDSLQAPQVPALESPHVPALESPQVPAFEVPQVPAFEAPRPPAPEAPAFSLPDEPTAPVAEATDAALSEEPLADAAPLADTGQLAEAVQPPSDRDDPPVDAADSYVHDAPAHASAGYPAADAEPDSADSVALEAAEPGNDAPPAQGIAPATPWPWPRSATEPTRLAAVAATRARQPAAEAAEFDFGPPDAAARSRPRGGWRGWLGVGFLLLLLAAQAAYFLRGPIAIVWPQTRAPLAAVCAALGCDVPLPRRADLVTLENSDLQSAPGRPGVMILTATLRNRAMFPQDFPAIELTLTNNFDQPLARRVIEPREYLASPSAEGFGASSETQIRLPIEAGAVQATGYRLYLFYP